MLAQVAQVLYPSDILPLREYQNGWLSQNSNHKIRVPFATNQNSQWSTSTGNSNNEIKRQGRHRRRLSKNARTLHRPCRWTRHRLRTPVPFTYSFEGFDLPKKMHELSKYVYSITIRVDLRGGEIGQSGKELVPLVPT